MEAISPSETASALEPRPTISIPQTSEMGPPLSSEDWKLTAMASHDDWRVKPKATIGLREMYLYRQRISLVAPIAVRNLEYLKPIAGISSAMGFQLLDGFFTNGRQLGRFFFCHGGVR